MRKRFAAQFFALQTVLKGVFMTDSRRKIAALLFIIVTAAVLFLFSGNGDTAYAAENLTDGTYTVSVSNDMPMGKDNISDTAVLEKQNGMYYLSLTFNVAKLAEFNVAKLADIRLEIEDKTVGSQVVEESEDTATYCYTLSEKNISSPLPFVADIVPMGQSGLNREIEVTADLSSAEKTNDTVENRGERPAEFVPRLLTNAGSEYLQETGTLFIIPSATAVLGDESCDVSVYAYYADGDELQPVSSESNRLLLENTGEYRIVYQASSALYKTSEGNDTYTEYIVKVLSDTGVSPLAKFEDINDILPEETTLQASRITSGTLYNTAAARMKTVSDRYEVFDVNLYTADGKAAELSGAVLIGISENSEFAGEEMRVYFLSESGLLGELTCTESNGYVEFETDRLGTFIVCIPGVAFVMPMWGYAVILAVCLFVAAAAITLAVIFVRKRRTEHERTNVPR